MSNILKKEVIEGFCEDAFNNSDFIYDEVEKKFRFWPRGLTELKKYFDDGNARKPSLQETTELYNNLVVIEEVAEVPQEMTAGGFGRLSAVFMADKPPSDTPTLFKAIDLVNNGVDVPLVYQWHAEPILNFPLGRFYLQY